MDALLANKRPFARDAWCIDRWCEFARSASNLSRLVLVRIAQKSVALALWKWWRAATALSALDAAHSEAHDGRIAAESRLAAEVAKLLAALRTTVTRWG